MELPSRRCDLCSFLQAVQQAPETPFSSMYQGICFCVLPPPVNDPSPILLQVTPVNSLVHQVGPWQYPYFCLFPTGTNQIFVNITQGLWLREHFTSQPPRSATFALTGISLCCAHLCSPSPLLPARHFVSCCLFPAS